MGDQILRALTPGWPHADQPCGQACCSQCLGEGVDEATDLRPAVYAAATLEALQIATDRWVASDGQLDLIALVDEATGLLTPASRRRTPKQ